MVFSYGSKNIIINYSFPYQKENDRNDKVNDSRNYFHWVSTSTCDKCHFTARDINGDALYAVNGQNTCEDQIHNEGEYRDC